jgi:hypothetical protein
MLSAEHNDPISAKILAVSTARIGVCKPSMADASGK